MVAFEHTGILACDPSFKGMAWTFYSPMTGFKFTRVYDIRDNKKGYTKKLMMVRLVREHMDQLWEDLGHWTEDITAFIIESQWTSKLMKLELIVDTIIEDRLAGSLKKKVCVPAYSWRDLYGLGDPDYKTRKQISVDFLAKSPKFLAWVEGIKDDNAAESIILLNYLVDKYNLRLEDSKPKETMETPKTCPDCQAFCILRISQSEKNPNRQYWICPNKAECGKGFVCWIGEENKPMQKAAYKSKGGQAIGQKRPLPAPVPASQPPTKTQKTPGTGPSTHSQAVAILREVRELKDHVSTEISRLATIIESCEFTITHPSTPQGGVHDLYAEEEAEAQDSQ